MEGNTTQTTGEAASVVNPIDDIASILMGEEEEQTGNEGQQTGPETTQEGEAEGQQTEGEGEESGEGEGEGEQSEEELTWAKALGVDDSQLVLDDNGNLKGIQVKVDGEVSTVGVKDLIAGYQLNKHVTQKSQALAEEKREFDNIRINASKALYEKLQQADQLVGYLNQNLLSEFEGVDWNALRVQNPGEYAAKVTDFQNKKARIDQIQAAIHSEGQELSNQYTEEQQRHYQDYVKAQYQKVIENNPQWADVERMKTDIAHIGNFVNSTYGIAPEEFAQVNDARYIEILKDAMAYRQGKSVVEKKVQNVPRMQKAGKPSKPMSKVTQLTLNARKATGHKQRDLQRDAIAAMLLGEN